MKISLSWLSQYIDVKEFFKTPEELSRLLTAAGLEVDAVQDAGKQFNYVVVGSIVELGPHPKADKLTLCQVDVGDGRYKQIVCGAKNHKQGDKVVVALPGAILPGDFAIKLSKIRDVESQGMLCSESELGLKDKSEGILILPSDAKIGLSFADFSGLTDIIFEINVTPNRADCLSHIGLAREISCLLDRSLQLPIGAAIQTSSQKTSDHIQVQLRQAELCPRYAGRSVFGVKVADSPEWLRRRLQAVGLNTINNIVDVTNFVMMEYGQPLHAFDAKEINSAKIIIDKARPGEKFTTFDGTELTLTGEELTIRNGGVGDSDLALALAGVIGGKNSGVTEKTTEIFLEAAHFNPRGVRRTSRQHGLETDSSQRFSRGTDPEGVITALDRAVALIQLVAGGEAAKDHYDFYPTPVKRSLITVRKSILESRLGYKINMQEFCNWMRRLHCKTDSKLDSKLNGKDEVVQVTVPAFRFDLDQEMDLVEEFARLNGYDKIPEHFPAFENWPTDSAVNFVNENRVAELIKNEGYVEARNYNFVSAKWQSQILTGDHLAQLGLNVGGQAVHILNPLSDETGQMRQSLLPGLLTNLLHNYHHGLHDGRMFETGFVFAKSENNYKESHRLAITAWGHHQSLWEKSARPVVFDIKSSIENIILKLGGVAQWREVTNVTQLPAVIHPGQIALLFYEGRIIGFVSGLHPAFREDHKIRHDVAVAEIDLEALMRGQPRNPKLSKISKYPAVERDLALVMPLKLAVSDVVKEIEKSGGTLLQSVEVFDVYTGPGVPEGQRSVAIRMVFQDLESTLSEERLNQVTQSICAALDKKFSIRSR